ncbi:cell wall assembly and cell proliferation coordinating protein [Ascoidea rubescens DSM 1968]|uniref:Cell wall assembly and cell proliferation coordinating protein n=1 Tax=Ascoidea rubescens DSM 1968 TaxID=1344418 RepID=A0A1D2VF90_9ASCO|nr:cell wall assembly and cell proliferation coordinating protein [Ascoidea rubescens DSM 1968]ODV60296.1 cell wall assembly and cell proliferation coordinating protein [Ascoidea rubescens DSM 1968]
MALSLKKRFNELLYSFKTNDRYSDYDANQKARIPTSNHQRANSTQDIFKSYNINLNSNFNDAYSQQSSNSSFRKRNNRISLQNFDGEGVSECILAWRHIQLWTSKNHPELDETLSPPVTTNDIIKAQSDLNIQFPQSLITSLRIHDGQDLSGSLGNEAGGLVFNLQLLNLEKIVSMTKTWRKVSEKVNNFILTKKKNQHLQNLKSPELTYSLDFHKSSMSKHDGNDYFLLDNDDYDADLQSDSLNQFKPHHSKSKSLNYPTPYTSNTQIYGHSKQNSTFTSHSRNSSTNTSVLSFGNDLLLNKKSNLFSQGSIPPQSTQPVYCHRDWVPLISDNCGNQIAVDLSPGPKGKWGQVIIFGRDFDIKFVIAPTWGDFLLTFAKDLENKNYIITHPDNNLIDDIYSGEGDLLYYDNTLKMQKNYLYVLRDRALDDWKKKSTFDHYSSSVSELDKKSNRSFSPTSQSHQRRHTYSQPHLSTIKQEQNSNSFAQNIIPTIKEKSSMDSLPTNNSTIDSSQSNTFCDLKDLNQSTTRNRSSSESSESSIVITRIVQVPENNGKNLNNEVIIIDDDPYENIVL